MPPIDWIHIAMFVAGLVLQYLTTRIGPQPAAPSAPTPAPATTPAAPTTDSKPLLDLVHKLLDQRQSIPSPFSPQMLDALMSVLNKLVDQPKPAANGKT